MSDSHGAGAHPKWLQHHFDTPLQQFDAAKLGMWAFLAQEVLFFSGLFVFYGIYRNWYPDIFIEGSALLNWKLGAANTVVLLFSSLTAAMAVRSAQVGDGVKFGGQKWTSRFLILTIGCACFFMVVKYFEYKQKVENGLFPGMWDPNHVYIAEHFVGNAALDPSAFSYELRSFFGIYFMMTGVHGLHVTIGIFLFIWILIRNMRGEFGPDYFTPVDLLALYWHLVDLIWIYLFPLIYLN